MESGISAEPMLTGFDKWDQVLIHAISEWESWLDYGIWRRGRAWGLQFGSAIFPIRQETVTRYLRV